MKLYTDLPREYYGDLLKMSPFNSKGKITKRVRSGLENALYLYSGLAKEYARDTENNPKNFLVKDVYIIGSGARENKQDSDLDLMLICPSIDERSSKDLKRLISYVLFNDRPKIEAIDVFIRAYDKYPERSSVKITEQVKDMVDKYNRVIVNKERD